MAVALGINSFDFSISKEFLIDPKEIEMGDMIVEGDHSVVFKGLFKNDIPVAVKIVEPYRTVDVSIEEKKQFEKEVWLLSKIKHENIAKFIGACMEPHFMIVTELLEGGTLQEFLLDSRPNTLDPYMSLFYAVEVSKAMQYLHSLGITHGDLKPRNMFLSSDLTQLKLTDFGIPRKATTGHMTNEAAGTYRWMAPEVYNGDYEKNKDCGQKADVYSFGLVLWELVTNETPFSGIRDLFVPHLVQQDLRPTLRDIPDEIASVLKSCWRKDPNARPEFKELAILLQNLIRGLCYNNTFSVTTSSEEGISEIASSEEGVSIDLDLLESMCEEMHRGRNKKKKKVVKLMMRPFIKIFKACLYKS